MASAKPQRAANERLSEETKLGRPANERLGSSNAPNASNVFGRMYQPRYLSGLVAGASTQSNIIGYVAAFPIPEVIRGINAFTLGVREVNPDAEVRVVWTNTWFGPPEEKEAADGLPIRYCEMLPRGLKLCF